MDKQSQITNYSVNIKVQILLPAKHPSFVSLFCENDHLHAQRSVVQSNQLQANLNVNIVNAYKMHKAAVLIND